MSEEETITLKLSDVEGLVALELANNDIGIYPAKITYADGRTVERTPKEEGHNDCVMEISKKRYKNHTWLESLPVETRKFIIPLIVAEKLWVNTSEDENTPPSMWIICNDVFYPAADGEDISVEELPELKKCLEECPRIGELLWIARKRKCGLFRHKCERWMTKEELALFDAILQ